MGSPGSGKTLLARATQPGRQGAVFSVSGSEFIGNVCRRGASRVRDMFQSKKKLPALILLMKSIQWGERVAQGWVVVMMNASNPQSNPKAEMDGFSAQKVVVRDCRNKPTGRLGCTALMRPGRFDRKLVLSYHNVMRVNKF